MKPKIRFPAYHITEFLLCNIGRIRVQLQNLIDFISSFTYNSCYLLAFRFLGTSFARYALVASCSFAVSYAFYERFPPLLPDLSGHPLTAAVVGGLFVGLGVGLVVRRGGILLSGR